MLFFRFITVFLFPLFFLNAPLFGDESAYAQLSSLQDQIPTSSKPQPVIMEVTHVMKNVELGADKNCVVVKEPGLYFIIASGQIGSPNKNGIGYFDLWLVKNGEWIPDSNARSPLDKAKSTGSVFSQYITHLVTGDTIAVYFSTSKPNLGLVTLYPEGEAAVSSFFFSMFKLRGSK